MKVISNAIDSKAQSEHETVDDRAPDSNWLKPYLDSTQMTRYQWMIVSVCVLIYIIDGFDILVMAFTAHSISQSWGLNGAQIGVLISCGLGGTALGSFFVAPLGDTFGRRTIILLSLGTASASMILSAYTSSALELGCLRLVTGICIGGVLTNCNVMTSEYSSLKWKSLTVCLLSTGYAVGATFGGLLAMYLERRYGWQIVFLIGGGMSLCSLIVALVALPESLYFLLNRKPTNHLAKLQKISKSIQLPHRPLSGNLDNVPDNRKSTFAELFKNKTWVPTILLWVALYCLMFGFYYILTWTPKVLTNSGLTNEQGISAGVVINFGAMLGTVLFGLLGARYKIKSLQIFFLICTAILVVIFGLSLSNLNLALMIGLVLGIFGVGATAGLHAMAPMIYPSKNRATGVGLAIGIGRLGSMSSPMVAGLMLDHGWKPTSLFFLVGVVLVISSVAVVLMREANSTAMKN